MKLPVIALSLVIFWIFAGYYGLAVVDKKFDLKGKVLAEKIEITPTTQITPTETIAPSPTLTPSPTHTPAPLPTKIPIPTSNPQPKVTSQEIHALMERFAGQYGVDVNILRHIAICESGFRENAVNGPYAGLFQFAKITWKNARLEFGEDPDPDLRFNAEEAVQTASYLVAKGRRGIWPNCNP